MANYGGGAPISAPKKSNVVSISGATRATVHGVVVPPKKKPKKRPKGKVAKPRAPKKAPKGRVPKARPPVDPYASQVQAATNTKYNPAIHALHSQMAQNQIMGGRIGSWYDEYNRQVNAARVQSAQG